MDAGGETQEPDFAMDAESLTTVLKCSLVFAAVTLLAGCNRQSSETADAYTDAKIVASFDGVPIAHEVHGTGLPTLVFVHGWSCDRSYWEQQLAPFSREFQVVIVDLAGHGESGLGRKEWTIESFGRDVTSVVEGLELQHVILIGHSMGGNVVVEAARRLPGRVQGLIWVDSHQQLGSVLTSDQVAEFLAPFRGNFKETTRTFVRSMFPSGSDESLVERVANDMSMAAPEVALAAGESELRYAGTVTVALQELDLPVIAINSGLQPTDIESMERYGVEVVVMSGVEHFPMIEDPQHFNPLLRDAVEKILQ